MHMIIPRSGVARTRSRCICNFNRDRYGQDLQWVQMSVLVLGFDDIYRGTIMTASMCPGDFNHFALHLFYSSHRRSSIILSPWKSSYNSPSEDLELPLRGRGEWLFCCFPGIGSRILELGLVT